MGYEAISKIVPTVMAAGLVQHNVNYLKSKKKKKSLIGLGITNIVGSSMIKETAGYTGGSY